MPVWLAEFEFGCPLLRVVGWPLLNNVEREKRWFETKWARQEEIRKIFDST